MEVRYARRCYTAARKHGRAASARIEAVTVWTSGRRSRMAVALMNGRVTLELSSGRDVDCVAVRDDYTSRVAIEIYLYMHERNW